MLHFASFYFGFKSENELYFFLVLCIFLAVVAMPGAKKFPYKSVRVKYVHWPWFCHENVTYERKTLVRELIST